MGPDTNLAPDRGKNNFIEFPPFWMHSLVPFGIKGPALFLENFQGQKQIQMGSNYKLKMASLLLPKATQKRSKTMKFLGLWAISIKIIDFDGFLQFSHGNLHGPRPPSGVVPGPGHRSLARRGSSGSQLGFYFGKSKWESDRAPTWSPRGRPVKAPWPKKSPIPKVFFWRHLGKK